MPKLAGALRCGRAKSSSPSPPSLRTLGSPSYLFYMPIGRLSEFVDLLDLILYAIGPCSDYLIGEKLY